MGRDELIVNILGIRPSILKKEVLDTLEDLDLKQIYENNRRLTYYQLLIKQQMIEVITYVYSGKYAAYSLYMLDLEDVKKFYLQSIRKTEKEFEREVQEAVNDFRESAIADHNEEYLSFSLEEQIIASDVIRPNPLLTDEEYQVVEANKKIENIEKELSDAYEDIESTTAALDNCRSYMARSEFEADIALTKNKIHRLNAEKENILKFLREQNDSFGGRR